MWKATLGVLCPVLVFPAQRETGETGDSPVESHRVGEGTAACLMRELGLHHLADTLTVNTRLSPAREEQGLRARQRSSVCGAWRGTRCGQTRHLQRLPALPAAPAAGIPASSLSLLPLYTCSPSSLGRTAPAAGQLLHPWSSRELWGLHSRVPHATERPLVLGRGGSA